MHIKLLIYRKDTQEFVSLIEDNSTPDELYANWCFSEECENLGNEIEQFIGFYYVVTQIIAERKCGELFFTKGANDTFEIHKREGILQYDWYCHSCGSNHPVNNEQVRAYFLEGLHNYGCMDEDQNGYSCILPNNGFEFSFFGFNPWLRKTQDSYVLKSEQTKIVLADKDGIRYNQSQLRKIKKMQFKLTCNCGTNMTMNGIEYATFKVIRGW